MPGFCCLGILTWRLVFAGVALFDVHAILAMAEVLSRTLACVLWRLRLRGGRSSFSRLRDGPLACCLARIAFSFSSCCVYFGEVGTSYYWHFRWLGEELSEFV